MEKQFKYIYKITCTKGKFKNHYYFGQHSTNKLDDGYKGSGKLILDYYKKYPNDYKKEIIAYYTNQEELDKAEIELIHNHIHDEKCLNICNGGRFGGFDGMSEEDKNLMKLHMHESQQKYWSNPENHLKCKEIRKKAYQDNPYLQDIIGIGVRKYYDEHPELRKYLSEKNKKYREEHPEYNEHYSLKMKEYYLNNPSRIKELSEQSSNSNWITNDIEEKFILKSQTQPYIDKGWRYGRLKGRYTRTQPESCKNKISQSISGKIKVNNGTVNKYIRPEEFNEYSKNGYVRGFIKRK